MRVAIIITLAITLVTSSIVSSTSARGHKTYSLYFPKVAARPGHGISLVRIVVTCGRIVAVSRIPDDWYVRTLRPATEFGAEWSEFKFAENAAEFAAGHGVTRLRSLKSIDGAIRIAVEDESCFDIVADIKDEMGDPEWNTRLRRPQLRLRK
ncbi:MAG TPA: hypothetical protein VKC61_00660 [Pyrinomonadaceae bacterium]|nr:hypothetical protein [Pyrinomonadaceae bacterium]